MKKLYKILFFIIVVLWTDISYSQTIERDLFSKALNYQWKADFDSSQYYCLLLQKKFPSYLPVSVALFAGRNYYATGDTINAELALLQTLSKADSLDHQQEAACQLLADIYIAKKQYSNALKYLDYVRYKPKSGKRMCMAGMYYWRQLYFNHKTAVCYYGLGQKPLAISYLVPYIFKADESVFIDDEVMQDVLKFFVEVFLELHDSQSVACELNNAIQNARYEAVFTTEHYGTVQWENLSVSYKTQVFGDTIDLGWLGSMDVQRKGEIPPGMSKEELLKEFVNSPAYRGIMGK